MNIWKTLGIKRTNDIGEIKRAYAKKAKEVHPEDNPIGFKNLYDAYTAAIRIARSSNQTSFKLANDNKTTEINGLDRAMRIARSSSQPSFESKNDNKTIEVNNINTAMKTERSSSQPSFESKNDNKTIEVNNINTVMKTERSGSQASFELTNENDSAVNEVNSIINEHADIFITIGYNEKVISQLLGEILDYRKKRKDKSRYVSEILDNEKFFDYLLKSPKIQEDFFAVIELECLKQKDVRKIRQAFTNHFKNNIPIALKPINVFLEMPPRAAIQWLFVIPYIAFWVSIFAAFAFAGVNSARYLFIGYILAYLGLMVIWAVSSFGKRIKLGKISRYRVEKKMEKGLLYYYFTQGICFILASLLFFNMESLYDKFYITNTVFLGLQMSTFASEDAFIQFGFFSTFFTSIVCYVIYLAIVSSGREGAQKEYYDPYGEMR